MVVGAQMAPLDPLRPMGRGWPQRAAGSAPSAASTRLQRSDSRTSSAPLTRGPLAQPRYAIVSGM
eukprot:2813054-Pyramimonas_sp.AAC.1